MSPGGEDLRNRFGGKTGDLFEKVFDFSDIAVRHHVIGDRRVVANSTFVHDSQLVPSVRLIRVKANDRGGVTIVEVEPAN